MVRHRVIFWVSSLVALLLVLASLPVHATSTYLVDINDYDYTAYMDAEKDGNNDYYMCWAAAASNVLVYTGWASNISDDPDKIFDYYQSYWSDNGGWMEVGWQWWLDGIGPQQNMSYMSTHYDDKLTNVSYLDTENDARGLFSGGFYPEYRYLDYYYEETDASAVMTAVADYLDLGYGVTLGIVGNDGDDIWGHAVTIWGYTFDDFDNYLSIFITDSDDGLEGLQEYELTYDKDNALYWIDDFSEECTTTWYIDSVYALAAIPVPLPSALLLLGGGLGILALTGRRRRAEMTI